MLLTVTSQAHLRLHSRCSQHSISNTCYGYILSVIKLCLVEESKANWSSAFNVPKVFPLVSPGALTPSVNHMAAAQTLTPQILIHWVPAWCCVPPWLWSSGCCLFTAQVATTSAVYLSTHSFIFFHNFKDYPSCSGTWSGVSEENVPLEFIGLQFGHPLQAILGFLYPHNYSICRQEESVVQLQVTPKFLKRPPETGRP